MAATPGKQNDGYLKYHLYTPHSAGGSQWLTHLGKQGDGQLEYHLYLHWSVHQITQVDHDACHT